MDIMYITVGFRKQNCGTNASYYEGTIVRIACRPDSQIQCNTQGLLSLLTFSFARSLVANSERLKFSRNSARLGNACQVTRPFGRDITRPGNRNWLRRYHLRSALFWPSRGRFPRLLRAIGAREHRGKYHRKPSIPRRWLIVSDDRKIETRAWQRQNFQLQNTRVPRWSKAYYTERRKFAVSQLYLQRPSFICFAANETAEKSRRRGFGDEIYAGNVQRESVTEDAVKGTGLEHWILNVIIGMRIFRTFMEI